MKTRFPLLLVLACTAALSAARPPVSFAQAQEAAPTPFEIVVHRHVMVSARDGVRLATDIYLPARSGVVSTRVPAIVERTPYNKDRGPDALVNFFVPHAGAAFQQRAYAPGIVTSALVMVPASLYLIQQSLTLGIISPLPFIAAAASVVGVAAVCWPWLFGLGRRLLGPG